MIIIKNNLIPFRGYKAIAILCFLFVRKSVNMSETDYNHERIHINKQMLEMLVVFFYLWYVIEFLIRWIGNGFKDFHGCYRKISFEQEAYQNQNNLNYLKERKPYAWIHYL